MRELQERDHEPDSEPDSEPARTGLAERAEWTAVADAWLSTAREHAVGGGSLILPPGAGRYSQCGPLSDGIEGFCRSFLLAGARLAHGGDEAGHAEWYANGLAAAMGTGSGSYVWGRAVSAGAPSGSGIQQPIVEAANLAFGLALCREQVWDRLDEQTRERLADWLAHHATLRAWDNNWLLFTAIIEAFLVSVGVDVPGGHMDEDVERVESWYLSDGWYNDGPLSGTRNIDHYNSWVIHPFLWQWYRLRGDAADPERRARMHTRLGEFAGNYARTLAPDGAPLHQGRSLTYRTAVVAGLWTAALAGVSPLSPARTRRLCTATRRHFEAFGVTGAQPPSLGWRAGHFEPSLQVYSGPGSPYFAGIGFLGLAAGPEHPLWAAGPDEGEDDERKPDRHVATWRSVGWLVASQRAEGVVRVANHSADHETFLPGGGDDPYYIKFGYSTHTAPGTGAAWQNGGIDGHFSLIDPWQRWTRRRTIEARRVTSEGVAVSEHTPRDRWGNEIPDTRIVSASCFIGADDADNGWLWEIRAHRVIGGISWDQVREGGYAVAADERPTGSADSAKGAWSLAQGDLAAVFAAVVPMAGYDASGLAEYQGSNSLGEHSVTPYLLGERHGARDTVHVAGHLLRRQPGQAEGWQPHLDLPEPPTVHVSGTTVTVRLGESEHVLELSAATSM